MTGPVSFEQVNCLRLRGDIRSASYTTALQALTLQMKPEHTPLPSLVYPDPRQVHHLPKTLLLPLQRAALLETGQQG